MGFGCSAHTLRDQRPTFRLEAWCDSPQCGLSLAFLLLLSRSEVCLAPVVVCFESGLACPFETNDVWLESEWIDELNSQEAVSLRC